MIRAARPLLGAVGATVALVHDVIVTLGAFVLLGLVFDVAAFAAVLALLLFGGSARRSFSTALAVGVVVGTYSSIYVASSLLLTLGVDRSSLLAPQPEA